MPRRIPEIGDDGLHRLNCPKCKRLLHRFHPDLMGGPVEVLCKPGCGELTKFYFNTGGPDVADAVESTTPSRAGVA